MKYMINVFESFGFKSFNVTTTSDDVVFTSFPAELGNSAYDSFLEQENLTDKEVHALKPNVWFESGK